MYVNHIHKLALFNTACFNVIHLSNKSFLIGIIFILLFERLVVIYITFVKMIELYLNNAAAHCHTFLKIEIIYILVISFPFFLKHFSLLVSIDHCKLVSVINAIEVTMLIKSYRNDSKTFLRVLSINNYIQSNCTSFVKLKIFPKCTEIQQVP